MHHLFSVFIVSLWNQALLGTWVETKQTTLKSLFGHDATCTIWCYSHTWWLFPSSNEESDGVIYDWSGKHRCWNLDFWLQSCRIVCWKAVNRLKSPYVCCLDLGDIWVCNQTGAFSSFIINQNNKDDTMIDQQQILCLKYLITKDTCNISIPLQSTHYTCS